jgi:hypothetical protein|tara:strand:- start:229 stop:459 length:231 start_codon:yes stop_codon:yes gene_type:complete
LRVNGIPTILTKAEKRTELKELVSAKKMLKEVLNYQETYSDRVEIRKDIREIETRIKEIKQQNATAQTFINSSRGE